MKIEIFITSKNINKDNNYEKIIFFILKKNLFIFI